jgi:hypothetical protein
MRCAKSGLPKQAETANFASTVAAMRTRPYEEMMATLDHQYLMHLRMRRLRIDDVQWMARQVEEVASKCGA